MLKPFMHRAIRTFERQWNYDASRGTRQSLPAYNDAIFTMSPLARSRIVSPTVVLGSCAIALTLSACGGSSPTAPTSTPTPSPSPSPSPSVSAVRAAVTDAYLREYGEGIPQPAIVNDASVGPCNGPGNLMTVAYLPSGSTHRMFSMYMARDGRTLVTSIEGRTKLDLNPVSLSPAGRFTVLTILLTYPATTDGNTLGRLTSVQQRINGEHAAFASGRGFASPIVAFTFTNIEMPGTDIANPRQLSSVAAALQSRGTSVSGFDVVLVLNINPDRSEGGFAASQATRPHFLYVGNYSDWRSTLTAANLDSIANTAYHHEMGHLWGWQHDWTPTCSSSNPFGPFITAPALFGWEDLDDDGVPEILDPTPYGRSIGQMRSR